MFKKAKEDEFLKDIFDRYDNDFNKDYNVYVDVYKDVKKKYTCALKNIKDEQKKLDFIKFERYRVENNIIEIESSANAIYASLFVLIVSIGITLFSNIFEDLDYPPKLIANSIMAIIFAAITTWLSMEMYRYVGKLKIYDVAIKALNDIEKERENKLEETIRKLDEALANSNNLFENANKSIDIANKKIQEIKYITK